MKTIWKYEIPLADHFSLPIPAGATFLSVQSQHDVPQSWWLVDPTAVKAPRVFRVIGTGHPIPDLQNLHFLGTFQVSGGSLVFHLFEDLITTTAPR